jgi:hypothetical protein
LIFPAGSISTTTLAAHHVNTGWRLWRSLPETTNLSIS